MLLSVTKEPTETRDEAHDPDAVLLQFHPDGRGPGIDRSLRPAVSRHPGDRLDVTVARDHDNPAGVGSDRRYQFSSDSHSAEEVHFHLTPDLILRLPFEFAEDHHRRVIDQAP